MQEDNKVDFKEIADSIPGLVYQMRFRKDGSMYWSYLSPAGIGMLGLEVNYIGTDILISNSSEEERQELLRSINTSVKNLTKWEYELEYQKNNGERIWLHCTGMPFVDGDEILMNGVLLDITEKKHTEILLKESEEKFTKALISSESWYRTLFENASDGITLMKDYLFHDCNPMMAEMFGCSTPEEVNGKSPAEFSPEFQADGRRSDVAANEYIDQAINGTISSFEWLHKKADGSVFFTEVRLSRMRLGEDNCVLAFVRDISARKQIERELFDLQQYLQLQIERMPIGLIIWDTDFRVKSWNPSAERIFGYSEEEAIGKQAYEIIVPRDLEEEINVILDRLLEGDEHAHSTNENITKSGKRITCSWSNTPFKTLDGELIGILSMVQDVTDQKRAEVELTTYQDYLEELVRERTVELEVANTNLDERERSVRLLSEITSASNLSADPEEAIFFAIERFSKHTGWPFGHMVYVDPAGEKTPSGIWYSDESINSKGLIELLLKCRFESEDCPINKAIRSRKPQAILNINPHTCHLINNLIDEYGLTNSYVFPVEIEDRIVGVIQFLYSDTGIPTRRYNEIAAQISIQLGMAIERKRVGDELIRAKSRAEEASRSKSQFLANMSHEIRTPMNSILGFADILSTRLAEERNLSYLESIRSSGESLMQILNDILDLSKVEAGKMEVDIQEVSMDSFFEDILYLFRQNILDKGLKLNVDISDKLPEVIKIDKLRLRQIVINLLSNAVKFTDKGKIDFSVVVRKLTKESFTLEVSIADTGVGISDGFIEHIFETFRQEEGDSARRYEGAGLGLAITKRLVDILNGEFLVESKKGQGSKFTIVLKNLEIVENIDQIVAKSTITPEMIRFINKRVMLVEDNPDDQYFFSNLMQDVGLEVVLASNGEDALQKIDSEPVDMIITDIRMPAMDGFKLLSRLKSKKKLSQIPVVAITASAMKEDIARIENHDFASYLLKPVQMSDFYTCIMDLIPHEEINYRARIEEQSGIDDLSVEARTGLPDLIKELETSYSDDWQKLSKKQPIEMVQLFGSKLRNLGQEKNIEILRIYGESLLASVDSFNVEAIKKDINNFPRLLKKLKSINKQYNEK